MKLSDFFSGQRVIRQILDWLQLSKANAIKERVQDVYSDGIVAEDSTNIASIGNLAILGNDTNFSLTDAFHIQVNTGVAYMKGERIVVDSSVVTYNYTNLVHTTDDGSGSPVTTPRSTGSFNIPLSANFYNHVWIAYAQTTDDSVFTLHKIKNVKQFYKRTDGYEILITTTVSSVPVNPDPTRYLLIGTINLSGSNTAIAANISTAGRSNFRATKLRVGIQTNNAAGPINPNTGIGAPTDRPAVYAVPNLDLSLDDHIKSIGTGPVSPLNPHGLSADDLGLTESQLVRSHRRSEHQNGLIAGTAATPAPLTSGLYATFVDVSIHGGTCTPGDAFYNAADYMTVQPLLGGELAVIDGKAFGNADFPTPVNIYFKDCSTTDPTGTYQIYFDSITGTVGKTTVSIVGDTTKLWLATISWNSGTLDLTGFIDRRRFGTVQRLTRWYTAGRPQGGEALIGSFGYNLDLNKLEYYNGTTWVALP